jgi:hypothetical protein
MTRIGVRLARLVARLAGLDERYLVVGLAGLTDAEVEEAAELLAILEDGPGL